MTPEPREGGGSERTGRASVLLPRRLRPPSVARSRLLVSFSRTALLPLLFSSLRCFHCRERACCASRSCSCSLPRLRSPLPPTVSSSPLATTTRSSGLLPSPVTLPPPPEATQSATPASSRCTVRPSVSLFPLPRERHADRPHRRTSGPRLPRFPGRRTTCGRHRRCGQELGLAVVQGALAAAALCGRAGDGTSTSALAGSPLPPCTNYGRAQALSVLMGALAASGEGLVGHVELKHRVRRPLSSRSRPSLITKGGGSDHGLRPPRCPRRPDPRWLLLAPPPSRRRALRSRKRARPPRAKASPVQLDAHGARDRAADCRRTRGDVGVQSVRGEGRGAGADLGRRSPLDVRALLSRPVAECITY